MTVGVVMAVWPSPSRIDKVTRFFPLFNYETSRGLFGAHAVINLACLIFHVLTNRNTTRAQHDHVAMAILEPVADAHHLHRAAIQIGERQDYSLHFGPI